jgi:FMN phosphatase YigB (HAD superfamily)
VRFFEYSAKMASKFSKASAIVIGDRMETDILGAHNFGLDSCWFNPAQSPRPDGPAPRFEIKHLAELKNILS